MRHVRYHPEADHELASTAVFYHNQAPGLGADFLDEVERTESFLIASHTLAVRSGVAYGATPYVASRTI